MRRSWSIIVAMSSVFALLTTSPLSMRDADAQDPYIGEIRGSVLISRHLGGTFVTGSSFKSANSQRSLPCSGAVGGDGKTTFALPDLRGRVVIGQGPGPGLTRGVLAMQVGTKLSRSR